VGLDGRGNAALFADYLQWEDWRAESGSISVQAAQKPARAPGATPSSIAKKKLSYIEQRELDSIVARIDALDAALAAARERVEDPAVATDASALTEALAELDVAQKSHDAAYERWAELTEKMGG
jgi:ATP-binding cassette subfamily F protein uup